MTERLTLEWIDRRIKSTQDYLASFKDGFDPARSPQVCLPGNEFLELLAAARQSLKAGEWRPIETAPKDGSYILGCGTHDQRGTYIDVIHFYRDKWTIVWMEGYGEPTHWQPLPPPPAASAPASAMVLECECPDTRWNPNCPLHGAEVDDAPPAQSEPTMSKILDEQMQDAVEDGRTTPPNICGGYKYIPPAQYGDTWNLRPAQSGPVYADDPTKGALNHAQSEPVSEYHDFHIEHQLNEMATSTSDKPQDRELIKGSVGKEFPCCEPDKPQDLKERLREIARDNYAYENPPGLHHYLNGAGICKEALARIEALEADLSKTGCVVSKVHHERNNAWKELRKAQAAIAKLEAENKRHERHEQTLRDNGIESHSGAIAKILDQKHTIATLQEKLDRAVRGLEEIADAGKHAWSGMSDLIAEMKRTARAVLSSVKG